MRRTIRAGDAPARRSVLKSSLEHDAMVTLKLKKPAAAAPGRSPRAPVRSAGPKARPTLAQAQAKAEAERSERDAARWPARREERPQPADRTPPRPRPEGAAPRRDAPPQRPIAPRPTERGRDAPPRDERPRPPRPAPSEGQVMAQPPESMRLSKRMSELGIASRREADEWIPKGWVRVDGRVVSELGSRVLPGQQITIDAKARFQQAQRVTVLLNKPVGWVSGQAEDGYEPAIVLVKPQTQWREDRSGIRFLPEHLRGLAPAGRLDIDSVGLLVLTQDGRIARQLVGEHSEVEKEYLVRVAPAEGEPLTPAGLALLSHGLELDGEALKPALVEWVNDDQLRFVLREGKKRQIRRMCEAVGLKVTGLKRVRIGEVVLGDLPSGQWRYLRLDERFV
jgi:23S rRNA pseudouridine2604 synthase